MLDKLQAKYKKLNPKQKQITAAATALVVILILVLIFHAATPQRSVAAYCNVFKQEKARLAKLPDNTWSSGVLPVALKPNTKPRLTPRSKPPGSARLTSNCSRPPACWFGVGVEVWGGSVLEVR